MPVTYPLDLTGINPANFVADELHSVSESRINDYYFIVPIFAPFYVDNFVATITIGGVERQLNADVDFSFALEYVTGTRTTGKAMYGAITLHNLELNGILKIGYQTIGSNQTANQFAVLTILADKAYNPRTTIWDILTNVPNALPPIPNHYQDYESFYGQEHVVAALNSIKDAILANSSLTADAIQQLLTSVGDISNVSYLLKAGDTMTGPLILYRDPVSGSEAATRQYVDNNTISSSELTGILSNYSDVTSTNTSINTKVSKVGDIMTGHLTLNADPLNGLHAATKNYVDSLGTSIQSQITAINSAISPVVTNHVTKDQVTDIADELLCYLSTKFNGSSLM